MYFSPRLFAMTRGLRPRIALAAVVGLLALGASIARLALTGWVIARVFEGAPAADLVASLAVLAGLIAARAGLQYARDAVSYRTATATKIAVRRRVYEHVLALGPGFVDQRRTGDILMSLVDGVESLETFFGQYLPQFVVALTAPVLIFAFVAVLDVQTGLILLSFAVFTLFIPLMLRNWTNASGRRRRKAFGELGAEFLDSVQGLATLKAFGQSKTRGQLLAARARNLYRSTMGIVAVDGVSSAATVLGMSAGATAALIWGGVRVSNGELELSTLVIVLMLGGEVFRPVRELASLYHQGMVAMASAEGIFSLLDTPITVQEPTEDRRVADENPAPEVTFEAVDFAYEGGRRPALREMSFTLRAGETLGLVGASGAGKTTIVWLLLRFYDPAGGRVLLGGHDLRDIPIDFLRSKISVVTQETYLFNGTVAENLRVGKPDASQRELEEAARAANAYEFVSALPNGFETVVGERGIKLSGGERQRIAIARALLKSAPILVLDEALSSVDAANEAAIQQALDRLMEGRTTLVIAHRLSSVVGADRILVIEDGRLVESGTHAELAAAGGAYTTLMANQQTALGEDIITTRLDLDGGGQAPSRPAVAGVGEEGADGSAREKLGSVDAWSRLMRIAARWRLRLSLTLVTGVAHHASVTVLGAASALLVSAVFRGNELLPYLVLLAVVAPLTALFRWGENWSSHDFAYKILAEMRIALYDKLEPLAPAYLVRRKSGDLTGVVGSDVETVENFFAHVIAPTFVALLAPTVVLAVLAVLSWPLALVLLPFLVVAAISPFHAQRSTENLGTEMRNDLGELNAYVVDGLQGIREVVAFGYGKVRVKEMAERGGEYAGRRIRFLDTQAFYASLIEAATALGGLAVLTAGVWLVVEGRMDRAALPLATLLALSSFAPVTELANTLKALMDTLGAVRRIFDVHDERVVVSDGPGVSGGLTDSGLLATPSMSFHGVGFSYESLDRRAIDAVTFDVEPGHTVALVGRSGAGKTTSAHMLLRFWDPDEGWIEAGLHDLRQFELDGLRRQAALVSQDIYLFNATVRENLRMARPRASDREIEEAARLANAHEFIVSFPDGYDTVVGERGMRLSGGQRQRLSIARAALKDAPILILDEATSHLDAVNEQQVRAALKQLMEGRTTLVIAHRLSTVRDADRIVVLDSGRLVEQGDHRQLLANGGLYAQLVQTQLVSAGGRGISTTENAESTEIETG